MGGSSCCHDLGSKVKILVVTHQEFAEFVSSEGRRLYRDMPWRQTEPDGTYSAYKILVSEVMLQQTQVDRVVPKFITFLQEFPTIQTLANTQLSQVLRLWSGLGYNRRAKYLYEAAQKLVATPEPWTTADLVACKGIGKNTAAAIRAYAYNEYEPFIETNIRTVLVHYFFEKQTGISDVVLTNILNKTADTETPREWYWALMDMGSALKKSGHSHLHRVAAHKRQPTFKGSMRQIRGQVLKELAEGPLLKKELLRRITDERTPAVISSLLAENLVSQERNLISLGS